MCEHKGSCLDTCCGWGPGIHIKTTLTRGQFLKNIVFKDNTIINNTGFISLETVRACVCVCECECEYVIVSTRV